MPGSGADAAGPICATFSITNKRGLHARASSQLVRLVEQFEAEITVSKDGTTVGGTSIMGLMLLAAGPGSQVEICADGPDAAHALDRIGTLIADRFGEGE
ncbi:MULTISPECIES: HPr family phosphocarrier protein [unclassified Roseitalea]|uniref:HPr family phosphocarrier protein n=1 Tax=unclassified Roseitalea TaxID=2639107 RepID=UPI00273F03AE|nr:MULTISPECIES: HPr family phosphocarrier protein [unclassified Roseitalea]